MESCDTGEPGERQQVDVPDRPILVYKIQPRLTGFHDTACLFG
jgi:hypothetical protein